VSSAAFSREACPDGQQGGEEREVSGHAVATANDWSTETDRSGQSRRWGGTVDLSLTEL